MKKKGKFEPPSSPIEALDLAYELADRKQYHKALQMLLPMIEVIPKPHRESAYTILASCYERLGDFPNAVEWTKKTLTETRKPEYHFYLGMLSFKLQEPTSAIHHLQSYLELEPNGEFADEARQALSIRQNELETLRQQDPHLSEQEAEEILQFRETAAALVEQGRSPEAIKKLREIIDRAPRDASLRNNLTVALLLAGRAKEAIREAEKVLGIDPQNLHALCNLAILHWRLKNRKKAVAYAAQAKQTDLTRAHKGFEKLTECLQTIEDDEGIYEVCRETLRENPSDRQAQWMMAVAAANLGRFQDAERRFDRAQAAYPRLEKVFLYRLDQLEAMQQQQPGAPRRMSYEFSRDDLSNAGLDPEETAELIKLNPEIKLMLLRMLNERASKPEFKEMSLDLLGRVGGEDVEQFLRELATRPHEPDQIKMKVLAALKAMGAAGPYDVFFDGELRQLDIVSTALPGGVGQAGLDVARAIMEMPSQLPSLKDDWMRLGDLASNIWTRYLYAIEPQEPIIEQPSDWAIACWALAAEIIEIDEKTLEQIIELAGETEARKGEIYDIMDEIDLALEAEDSTADEEDAPEGMRSFTAAEMQILQEYASRSFDELITLGSEHPEDVWMMILPLEGKINKEVEAGRVEHVVASLEQLLERATDWSPEDPRLAQSRINTLEFLYSFLARAYEEAGLHAEAVRTVEAGLQVSDAPMLWERLGYLRLAEGNFEEAVQCWWRAVRLDPTDFHQVLDTARACLEYERLDEAEEFLQTAINNESMREGRIELMDALAEVYEQKGEPQKARATLEELFAERPVYDQQVVLWTKRALQINRKIQALDRLKNWADGTAQMPGIPTAHLLLALVHLGLGKEKQVRQRLRRWKEATEALSLSLDVDWELLEASFSTDRIAELRTYLEE